jgi:N-acyl-D-amino-acid deacylase
MTGFPAEKLGLADRGKIATGYKADVVIFDPETIIDTATFQDPFHYPKGIDAVIVNGTQVLREGAHTGERPGTVILRNGKA